jgi:hypothetical protein
MKKFLVLYRAWGKKAAASIVDMGAPLGKSLKVTNGGSSPSTNDLGGYSVLQAESKEALAETLKGHPHFMTPDGTIEVVEITLWKTATARFDARHRIATRDTCSRAPTRSRAWKRVWPFRPSTAALGSWPEETRAPVRS